LTAKKCKNKRVFWQKNNFKSISAGLAKKQTKIREKRTKNKGNRIKKQITHFSWGKRTKIRDKRSKNGKTERKKKELRFLI
jgi:hypothetical protein